MSGGSKGTKTTSAAQTELAVGDQPPPTTAGKNPAADNLFPDRVRNYGEPAPGYLPSATSPLPGRTFEGVVLDAKNRTPLNARVGISIGAGRDETRQSTTASDGRFAIVAPIASQYGVYAIARGYQPYRISILTTSRDTNHLEILLERQLQLRGRIVDARLNGIPRAHVWLKPEPDGKPVGSTLANDEGSFVLFRNILPGHYLLQAYHPAYEDGSVVVSVPATEEIVVQLNRSAKTGSISGRVIDTRGLPVNGARIEIGNTGNLVADQTVAGGKGDYRFAELREGEYFLRCSADGYMDKTENDKLVSVSSGREQRVDFVLSRGDLSLEIFVRNRQGKGAARRHPPPRPHFSRALARDRGTPKHSQTVKRY